MTNTSSWTRRIARIVALAGAICAATPRPAHADVTAFLGLTPTPDNRIARGFAGGLSLVLVGFEFEVSDTPEDLVKALPQLRTWSGNVLVQTPIEVSGVSLYATAGAGGYQEGLLGQTETNVAINIGGGAKIRIAGPLRVRLDYRVFTLQGDPIYQTYHRFYAGANIAF